MPECCYEVSAEKCRLKPDERVLMFSQNLETVRRCDRLLAPIYPLFELVFLLPRDIRNKAVERLGLAAGERVLEVGCGTGRNLRYLTAAVALADAYPQWITRRRCCGGHRKFAKREVGIILLIAGRCCSTQAAGNG